MCGNDVDTRGYMRSPFVRPNGKGLTGARSASFVIFHGAGLNLINLFDIPNLRT